MQNNTIYFNQPSIEGNEFSYISEAIKSGHISGDGTFTKRCRNLLENSLGVSKVLLTTSCTHALEMSAILLDINPGDEVIVPAYTFVSTVNAFVLRGAKPIFIDIKPDTLNLDESILESLISDRTRAIVPVHYAGVGCEMDVIMKVADKYDIPVVEDNAHGLFGKYKNRFLGTFGELATQSFHETKNFTCGEGGALLINNPAYIDRAEIIREKGTNRSRFFRGQVDKYSWVDVGSSYLPSEILAAFLLAQLEVGEQIQSHRKQIWLSYQEQLKSWANENDVILPTIPTYCEQTYHIYYMLLPSLDIRQRMIAYLKQRDIQTVFHYLPLHLSDMGRRFGWKEGDCPITENVSDRLLRLPLHNHLSESDVSYIVEKVKGFNFKTE